MSVVCLSPSSYLSLSLSLPPQITRKYSSSQARKEKSFSEWASRLPTLLLLPLFPFEMPKTRILLSMVKMFVYYVRDCTTFRPTFDEGPRSKFLGTNLDSFQVNWILEFNPTLHPSLHLGSPNHELSFEVFSFSFLRSEPIDFPSKMVLCKLSLNLPLFGLGPYALDPHLKWPLIEQKKIIPAATSVV